MNHESLVGSRWRTGQRARGKGVSGVIQWGLWEANGQSWRQLWNPVPLEALLKLRGGALSPLQGGWILSKKKPTAITEYSSLSSFTTFRLRGKVPPVPHNAAFHCPMLCKGLFLFKLQMSLNWPNTQTLNDFALITSLCNGMDHQSNPTNQVSLVKCKALVSWNCCITVFKILILIL